GTDIEPVGVNVAEMGSNSSALLVALVTVTTGGRPPAINTFPLGSSVAVWNQRPMDMFPTAVNEFVDGSKVSAVFTRVPSVLTPPVISTKPLGSSVAVWLARVEVMPDVATEPDKGSNTSALLVTAPAPPPASSTLPLGSTVAVWFWRAVIIEGAMPTVGVPAMK